mmetsp:Transcript_2341/g.5188  ORF Transcript_2341/g.5188 Transcript_2341/m.5188 type:complete len:270 (+) Transcript_2341:173-982(+)
MAEKVQGSVKWFSNKKGYGFITPADGSPVSEDIFVHQSSVHCEGYRTLDEGWAVEFEIGNDDDGKVKAVNVTAPGGGPCSGPRKNRRNRHEGGKKEGIGARNGGGGGGGGGIRNSRGPAKPKEPFWHEVLNDSVKEALQGKGIRTSTGTIDVSVGDARVKLGTRGYSSMAHAQGIIAEGTFECDADGNAKFNWEHCISFDSASGAWVATPDKAATLLSTLSLSDANVVPVGADETDKTLWGEGPVDPKSALEENGFQMRRVVLTPRRRR